MPSFIVVGYVMNRVKISCIMHCLKSVRIRSYSGPHFSCIFPHSDWIRTPYIARMRENTDSVFSPNAGKCRKNADQNNSEYGLFLRSAIEAEKNYQIAVKETKKKRKTKRTEKTESRKFQRDFRGVFRTWWNIHDKVFCENSFILNFFLGFEYTSGS